MTIIDSKFKKFNKITYTTSKIFKIHLSYDSLDIDLRLKNTNQILCYIFSFYQKKITV
jgi:hypothetical protein